MSPPHLFFREGRYELENQELLPEELSERYSSLLARYPFSHIEDPFNEDDFESFSSFSKKHRDVLVIGDDLTTTSTNRIKSAASLKSIGGVVIKPNQIGTLSETLEAMKEARDNNIECIVSHRSGETNDSFIADLAFAFGCFGIKAGGLQRGERMAKYNRLSKIERIILNHE